MYAPLLAKPSALSEYVIARSNRSAQTLSSCDLIAGPRNKKDLFGGLFCFWIKHLQNTFSQNDIKNISLL